MVQQKDTPDTTGTNGEKPAQPDRDTPMLEITTFAPKDYVRIDGVTYDLADLGKFGLLQRSKLMRQFERIDRLEKLEEPTADDEKEYRQRLEVIAKTALPELPEEVGAKLDTGMLADVALAFFVRVANKPRMGMLRKMSAGIATSESSSPESSASTAGTRSDG